MFHNMYDMYGHGWGMGWGLIIGLIILAAIVWMIIKSVNRDKTPTQPGQQTPLDILKERYARGEIDKQEFEERKKDLG